MSNCVPQWLTALLTEKFFNACITHEDLKKNEKNIFCLDCCDCICPHCLVDHDSHRLLRVRRYVYHDVLRLDDADKLMDCAFVQSYFTNSSKVVFLKQRHQPNQPKSYRGVTNPCVICDRAIQEKFLFCSLFCKLKHMLNTGTDLSKYVYKCENIALPEPVADDGQLTPDTVFEPAGSAGTESGSMNYGVEGSWILACTATTDIVRKKRSSVSEVRPACRPVVDMSNRRKGTPHRSPLY